MKINHPVNQFILHPSNKCKVILCKKSPWSLQRWHSTMEPYIVWCFLGHASSSILNFSLTNKLLQWLNINQSIVGISKNAWSPLIKSLMAKTSSCKQYMLQSLYKNYVTDLHFARYGYIFCRRKSTTWAPYWGFVTFLLGWNMLKNMFLTTCSVSWILHLTY